MTSPYPGGQRSPRAKTLKRHNYPLVWICIPNWVDPTPWGYWDMLRTKSGQDFQWYSPYPGGQRSPRAKTLKRHNYPLVWICIPNWVTLPLGVTEICSGQSPARIFNDEPLSWRAKVTEGKNPEKAQLPPSVNMHAKLGDPTLGVTEICSGQSPARIFNDEPLPWRAKVTEGKNPEKAQLPPSVTMHAKLVTLPLGVTEICSGQSPARIFNDEPLSWRVNCHWGQKPWKGTTTP